MSGEDLQRTRGGNAIFGQNTGASYQVETLDDLRAVDVALMSDGMAVIMLGRDSVGDGGGGTFRYSESSVATENGGTVIAPDAGGGMWLRSYGSFIDMRWFGDVENALAAAFSALSAGGTILLSPSGNTITEQVSVPTTGKSYIVQGNGVSASVIRDSSYPAGDLFYITTGSKIVFRDFLVQNAEGFQNTSGYAFNFDTVNNSLCAIERVWIYNGKNGVKINASDQIFLDKVMYRQSSTQVAAGWGADAGLRITGLSTGIFVSNCLFSTQAVTAVNALARGIHIDHADGLQVVNCHIKANVGIGFVAAGTSQMTNIFFSNCIIDECFQSGVSVDGTTTGVFQNVRFSSCQIVGYGLATETSGIYLDCPDLAIFQIADCNIDGWRGDGVTILQGTYISVDGCDITDVDAADSGNWCVRIAGGTNIKVNGGVMGALNQGSPLVNGAVAITSAADYVSVTGVACINCQGEPIGIISMPTHIDISGNFPQASTIPSVTSASSITAQPYDTIKLTGSTGVNTILGGWTGRKLKAIIPSGLTFGTSGNIYAAVVKGANTLADLAYDGTKWTVL